MLSPYFQKCEGPPEPFSAWVSEDGKSIEFNLCWPVLDEDGEACFEYDIISVPVCNWSIKLHNSLKIKYV